MVTLPRARLGLEGSPVSGKRGTPPRTNHTHISCAMHGILVQGIRRPPSFESVSHYAVPPAGRSAYKTKCPFFPTFTTAKHPSTSSLIFTSSLGSETILPLTNTARDETSRLASARDLHRPYETMSFVIGTPRMSDHLTRWKNGSWERCERTWSDLS